MRTRLHSPRRPLVLVAGVLTATTVVLGFPVVAAAAAVTIAEDAEPDRPTTPAEVRSGADVPPEDRRVAMARLRNAMAERDGGADYLVSEPSPETAQEAAEQHEQEARAAERRSRAETAVATAMDQIGDPYVWAAEGPDAFDCSGLTLYAWAKAGVMLPHNSARQYATLPSVSRNELRPGDLVFSGHGGISHVGMYIGGGRMVHASQTGEPVKVSPLRSNYIGAARPG